MADLNSIVLPGEGADGFACGSAGTLLVTKDSGNTWKRVPVPTRNDLLAVWFSEDMTLGFCTGVRGTLLRCKGSGHRYQS